MDAHVPLTKCCQKINMDTNKRATALSKLLDINVAKLLETVEKELTEDKKVDINYFSHIYKRQINSLKKEKNGS